ncbi:MAG TPA: tetratricopeptide repeat protein [Candidatus Angelobacter sp.]|nr:tetratricopeptide repeat protein [Candidatus Angelobacter sp.]
MEQAARSARLLRFGVYELDLEAGELRKSGRKVSLQEQPFQVLVLLLAHPGQLVTREELQKRLWPADTFVDFDLGLNTAIKKIRAALGDSADNPTFVETLPRRGYRFLCQVEEVASSAPGTHSATEKSAALAETRFGIAGNATGTVNRSHTRFWLALGSLAVVLAAGLVFYRLHNRTTHSGRTKAELEKLGERGTQVPAAYDFYSKGRNFLQADRGPDQSDKAIEAFDQALKADPLYTLAYGLRGEAYMKKYKATGQDTWKVRAQTDCDRAVDMDPTRPAGRICQGMVDNGTGEYKQAVKDFSSALAIDPLSSRAYKGRAWAYQRWDKIAEAEKDYLKVIELDPANSHSYITLAQFYFNNSRFDNAAQQYKRAITIDPDNSALHSSLGAAYEETGRSGQAVAEFQEAIRLEPTVAAYVNLGVHLLNARRFPEAIESFQRATAKDPQDYRGYGGLARAYFWATGQRPLALKTYRKAIELAEQKLIVNPDDPDVNLMLAVYRAMLGEENEALYRLDLARQSQPDEPEVAFWAAVVNLQLGDQARALARLRQARSMNYSSAEIMGAPELDSLHADPEFRQIMAGGNSLALNSKSELDRRTK